MKILFVDDEENMRFIIEEFFIKQGKKNGENHEIVTCKDLDSAIKALQTAGGGFDIVVTDNDYPGGGPALVKYIQQQYPKIPVVMFTGNDPRKLQDDNEHLRRILILEKTIRLPILYESIKNTVDKNKMGTNPNEVVEENLGDGLCPFGRANATAFASLFSCRLKPDI